MRSRGSISMMSRIRSKRTVIEQMIDKKPLRIQQKLKLNGF